MIISGLSQETVLPTHKIDFFFFEQILDEIKWMPRVIIWIKLVT
jgi:hypothetical protein